MLNEEVQPKLNALLAFFKNSTTVNLVFSDAEITEGGALLPSKVAVNVQYNGRNVPNPSEFLNEARLTALAISIYLASLLTMPLSDYSVLFLDDVFIGLDMSNRLPLLDILTARQIGTDPNDTFTNHQIFMTTYDRHWFEVAKDNLPSANWAFWEMYAQPDVSMMDIPIITPHKSHLSRALRHLNSHELPDYSACANYLRKEAEEILKTYIPKEEFKILEGEHEGTEPLIMLKGLIEIGLKFLTKIECDTTLLNELKSYLRILLNPFSHYNITTPIHRGELIKAIHCLKSLRYDFEVISSTFILKIPSRNVFKLNIDISDTHSVHFFMNNLSFIYAYKKAEICHLSDSEIHFSEVIEVQDALEIDRKPFDKRYINEPLLLPNTLRMEISLMRVSVA